MSAKKSKQGKTGTVVERLRVGDLIGVSCAMRPISRLLSLGVVAVMGLIMWISGPVAVQAQASPSDVSVSSSVTDTQNLLGADLSRINDTISSTKASFGVDVRLLYLSSFTGGGDPDTWAADALASTDPPANTVLLAVASKDGRLVVAVSRNSEAWLKDGAGELSDAALRPIEKGNEPDWSGAAMAMMEQIGTLHQRMHTRKLLIAAGSAIAVLLVVVLAAVYWLRVRRRRRVATGRRHRKTTPTDADGGPVVARRGRHKHRRA